MIQSTPATNNRTRYLMASIYTLAPMHCGTGQTAGAVDLPIAREAHTGLPVLPATSIKGVARDEVERQDRDGKDTKWFFGPDTSDQSALSAGALLFTEGRLIAYPMRSLNQPFLYVTCPLILERLKRDLRAFGREDSLGDWSVPRFQERQAYVVDPLLAGKTLVLEDLVYTRNEVTQLRGLETLAEGLSLLLPENETDTRERLKRLLVVLPDDDFQDAISRVVPVRARIKLGEGKTTGGSGDDSGNLWYEESLPSDCLFVTFVGERRRRFGGPAGSQGGSGDTLELFQHIYAPELQLVQMGGNETVGYGLCWWTFAG